MPQSGSCLKWNIDNKFIPLHRTWNQRDFLIMLQIVKLFFIYTSLFILKYTFIFGVGMTVGYLSCSLKKTSFPLLNFLKSFYSHSKVVIFKESFLMNLSTKFHSISFMLYFFVSSHTWFKAVYRIMDVFLWHMKLNNSKVYASIRKIYEMKCRQEIQSYA